MRLTNDQIYELLLDEWRRTKDRMYDTDDLDEMREYMDYLEVLDNLMFKYEEGLAQKIYYNLLQKTNDEFCNFLFMELHPKSLLLKEEIF